MIYSLYLAHINDTHSHFEPTPLSLRLPLADGAIKLSVPCGGYAMIASAINNFRNIAKQQNTPSLFLHAGDSFQGSLYFSRFKGLANAVLLNKMMPDAMTIGNHEFDLGNLPLSQFIKAANFPCLAGNMDLQFENPNKELPLATHDNLFHYDNNKAIASYITRPLHDKEVAIVGITLDQMAKIGCPDHDCHFLDAIATTRRTIEYIQQQGISHIIVLSHLGYQGDRELAQAVSGISVIVGGHSHTLTGDFSELGLSSTEQSQVVINDTLILQAGKHAESIGLSRLTFDENGRVIEQEGGVKLLPCTNWYHEPDNNHLSADKINQCNDFMARSTLFESTKPCAEVTECIYHDYRPLIEAMKENVITNLSKDYRHVRVPNESLPSGSEIAPLVASAFYHCANEHLPTDFALHNAGGVRVSLNKGPLTAADICGRLLPFEIQIVRYKVQGKILKAALEGGINNAKNNGVIGTGDGSYPYCHGIRFTYVDDNPIGERISSLMINQDEQWQEISPNAYYYGVSSAYTIAGKEGYDALLHANEQQDLPYSMSDAFVKYVSNQKL